MKLEKIIKRNKKLYALIRLIKLSKDAELINVICKSEGVYSVIIHDMGDCNPDKLIYYIAREDQNEGFFAMLRTTLYQLEYADRFHLTPYIRWSNKCSYYQENGYMGCNNPFEYYFKQYSDINESEIECSKNVIYAKDSDVSVLKAFPLDSPYYYSSEFVSEMAKVMKKYISLQASVEAQLNQDVQKIFEGHRILGIHYRGTDFKQNYDSHPVALMPSDYYRDIEMNLKKYSYDRIFIATDDQEALKEFKDRFGKNIVYYEDTLRAEGKVSVMYSDTKRENNNFLKGYEVLRDVYTMAHASGLISGVSMVSVFARVFKKMRNETFEIDVTLNKGVNCNNNKWITMK